MGPHGADHPRVAIVSSSEFAAQPGAPLNADYYVNREPGESWAAFRVRRQAEAAEDRAESHEGHAYRLRVEAAAMRNAAGLPAAAPTAEYERGRAETLALLAGMTAAERADVLDQVAAMIEATTSGGAPAQPRTTTGEETRP
jgi:hypothetical protein